MPGRVLFLLSNFANRSSLLQQTPSQQESSFGPNGRRTVLNQILSTFSHHPARLILGDCERRDPGLLSLHAQDLVLVVRERIRKNQLRVYDGMYIVVNVFRGRFVVLPSKIVTNAYWAVCIRSGDFLPGPGARQSGRTLFFCRRAIR